MTVRSCLPDEAEAVLRLWRDAEAVPSVTDDPASVRALIDHDGDAVLVAEEGGRIVGCLVAGWDGWRGHMYRLAVLPEHRRRGVARALVAEGERRLRARGAPRVAAIVVTAHEPAVGFWEAAGYARDRRVGRFVRNVEPA